MPCTNSIALLATLLLTALPARAAEAPEKSGLVAVQAKDIVVDGRLTETCWQQAQTARADYIHGKTNTPSEAPRGAVRYAWDNDYLYIGYETFDANLVAKGNGIVQGPEGNQRPGCHIWGPDGERPDVVEFFLAVDDAHYMWELHHNAANEFNDVWCVIIPDDRPYRKSIHTRWGIRFCNAEFLEDDGARTVKFAAALKPKADGAPSTVNKRGDRDTGYTAEIRIPWRSLAVPTAWGHWVDAEGKPAAPNHKGDKVWAWRPAGKVLRALMVVQDMDLKQRYHHSSPTLPGGWFHHGYQHWPEYTLGK